MKRSGKGKARKRPVEGKEKRNGRGVKVGREGMRGKATSYTPALVSFLPHDAYQYAAML